MFSKQLKTQTHNFRDVDDHRLLQPTLGLFASILVALDDHVVMADENRHCFRIFASSPLHPSRSV